MGSVSAGASKIALICCLNIVFFFPHYELWKLCSSALQSWFQSKIRRCNNCVTSLGKWVWYYINVTCISCKLYLYKELRAATVTWMLTWQKCYHRTSRNNLRFFQRTFVMFITLVPLILFYSFGFIFLLVMKLGGTWVAMQNLPP